MRYRYLTYIVCLVFLLSACAHLGNKKNPGLTYTSESFKFFKGEFENTPYFLKHKPKSIAVAPFELDLSTPLSLKFKDENPANIVRIGLYNHLSSLPFQDLELYQVDKRLQNAGLNTYQKIKETLQKNPKKLKSILGVEALVTGKVTHFDRIFVGIFSQVAVGCEVKMWDLETGKLLWRAKQVSRATGGGVSLSPIGLALNSLAALWNMRGEAMLTQTDKLFREMVSTIDLPKSSLSLELAKPQIDLFLCLNAQKTFKAGEKITFRLIGDKKGKAYVDLGNFKVGIELKPLSATLKQAIFKQVLTQIETEYLKTGHTLTPDLKIGLEQLLKEREIYEGSYTVEPGDNAQGLMAKGYLISPEGAQSTQLDGLNLINIDTNPPKPIKGFKSLSLDGKIELSWLQNKDPDLAYYEIWISDSPLSHYNLLKKVETNKLLLTELTNFQKKYFKIRAVDKAGNYSPFSNYLEATPLPEPALYTLPQPGPNLGGNINTKIFLSAQKSPYLIQSDLIITKEGSLYIEPGCKIKFLPETALYVQGGSILAYGQKNNPIYFLPANQDAPAGAFQGLILDGAKKAILQYIVIERAKTGIRIRDCSPLIKEATIKECSQAGIYLQKLAKPEISCSHIINNQGMGGIVLEGEGLAPLIHNNTFLNNYPFQIQSYTPLSVDFSKNYWGEENSPTFFLGDLEKIILTPLLEKEPKCEE